MKPENVILYPETPELVILFDFDSAVQIEDIQQEYISFTKSWSAPEVLQRKVQNIGICSDVYAIGALLLFLIFGRNPALSDRTKRASWNFENSILSDESPELKRMVTDLLKHTLCADVKSRYDSCQRILDVIEPFIESFQKQKPYLKTFLPMNANYFCGRDREISEIHEHLKQTDFLVLHGIGGIGKSELAKHYAMNFSSEYDAIIFVRYQSSILETIANDALFPVVNLSRESDESDENYFTRKMKILQKICTPRHLIILDNFDTDECENLDELLSLDCKFLITSRVDFEDIFPQYEVDILDDFDSLRAIFSRYSKQELDIYADNIIIALEGHTMAVELVSKQMKLNNISTEMMYQKLCEKGIYADDNKIKNLKDGSLRNKEAYAHIEILFSIFDLNETEKQILKYIAMIGSNAMQIDYFKGLCELSEMEEISFERLVKSGWIQTAEQDEISVLIPHTLIVDVLCKQLQPDSESCTAFVLNAASVAVQIDSFENADERKAAVQWLDHMTRTISGKNEELAYFFRCMVYPVYLGENNYQMVLFAAQKELKILESSEMEGWIVTALFFARAAADRLGDKESFQKFDILLKEKDLTEEYHIHILQADLLQDIANQDYISAKNTVKQIMLIAERIGNDRILANSYSNAVWFENVFGTEDFDKKYYAELALQHMDKFFSTHFKEFEPDSRKLADFYSDYGDVCRDCKKYEQAIEYYQNGLKTIQNTQAEKQDFLITSYS
ncbi:MAG: hypothetical protein IKP69_04610, partial [Oscillospiraceae bacterium]|nr:hypothetical protein [Oscillospiraceae bacterium]